MTKLKKECQKYLPGVLFEESLEKYSTFRIGGKADFFYKLKSNKEFPSIIKFCINENLPFFIFGAGSNILFSDKGFRGLVIKIETEKLEFTGTNIKADAGVLVSKLIKESVAKGLSGLEKWVGLPGTVGGAVRGNAGCNGLETRDILIGATILDPKTGSIQQAKNAYFHYDYRYSKLKRTGEIVLDATFKLEKRKFSAQKQKQIMDEIRKFRQEKQPFGSTTGSFFKNPSPDTPAGMLIDQAGLKGKTIGKAKISEKHANFFLNNGGASYKDILKLAKLAKRQVKAKFGVILEEEVQILSEKAPITLAV